MADTRLSVIIPAYNVEKYVVQAIRSVLEQSITDLEAIVINDGSTDDTAKRIREIDDPRMRVINQSNSGISAARNAGIRMSSGTYIGFLDGDDIWLPQKAEKHLLLMQKDERIGVSYSYLAYISDDGKPTHNYYINKNRQPTAIDLIRRSHIITSSAIVRKACFLQAGLFDENLRSCEDYEMWIRIALRTQYKALLLPEPLTRYRIRNNSLSKDYSKFIDNAHLAMNRVCDIMPSLDDHLKKRALAEIYRSTAKRALDNGAPKQATKMIGHSIYLSPFLYLTDIRAITTLILLLIEVSLPRTLKVILHKIGNRVLNRIQSHTIRANVSTS
jgi:glycosyltransferase involved in cell wall biosynthesis